MRGSNGTNPAAGKRSLGARSHARLLDDQTECLARVIRADEILIEVARLVGALHTNLRSAEGSMRSANERASSATYEPPVVASMAWAA